MVPPHRVRYLSEIADTVRAYHAETRRLVSAVRRVQRLEETARDLAAAGHDTSAVDELLAKARKEVPEDVAEQLANWPNVVASYSGDEQVIKVRDREIRTRLHRESLAGTKIPRVALPRYTDHGELVSFLRRENLPGFFPFTAGVFPFKRDDEEPARMFAGKATRSAPTGASNSCPKASPRPGSPPRSTPSPCTAATRIPDPTSTARSAPPESPWPRSTT